MERVVIDLRKEKDEYPEMAEFILEYLDSLRVLFKQRVASSDLQDFYREQLWSWMGSKTLLLDPNVESLTFAVRTDEGWVVIKQDPAFDCEYVIVADKEISEAFDKFVEESFPNIEPEEE